jgi:hypothetical protein
MELTEVLQRVSDLAFLGQMKSGVRFLGMLEVYSCRKKGAERVQSDSEVLLFPADLDEVFLSFLSANKKGGGSLGFGRASGRG